MATLRDAPAARVTRWWPGHAQRAVPLLDTPAGHKPRNFTSTTLLTRAVDNNGRIYSLMDATQTDLGMSAPVHKACHAGQRKHKPMYKLDFCFDSKHCCKRNVRYPTGFVSLSPGEVISQRFTRFRWSARFLLSLIAPARQVYLASLTTLSEAILARRAAADSTNSTARPHNNARRVL